MKSGKRMIHLDLRIHLFILFLTSFLSFSVDNNRQLIAIVSLAAIYLIVVGLTVKALKFILLFIFLKVAIFTMNIFSLGIFLQLLYVFSHLIPMIMIAAAFMSCSPSAIMYTLERMRFPKQLNLIVVILVRFFPVILREFVSIWKGLQARGIFNHWYSMLFKPVLAYESVMMPIIIRSLKLSSELSASAILRGIEIPVERTSRHPVGIRKMDVAVAFFYCFIALGIFIF